MCFRQCMGTLGSSYRRTPLPPIQNRTANAICRRFYARNGGERSEQIALRSHDADLAVGNFNSLGQGAEMVAIPLHADCSPLHRSTAAELSCARCKQRARPATRMTIGRHCVRRPPPDLVIWDVGFIFDFHSTAFASRPIDDLVLS